ncbi:MAG: hypothetical protein GYB33_14875 [Gammaproteobacteria bacterium]|nr:hypothetical protein [Gammaproteobacteria bacterium]
MSSDALHVNPNVDAELADAHLFGGQMDDQESYPVTTDARRKLEEKLEEMRLRRDLMEFDFDF